MEPNSTPDLSEILNECPDDVLRSHEAKSSPLQGRLDPSELRQLQETVQTTINGLDEFRIGTTPADQLPPETLTRIADFACNAHMGSSDQAVTMSQVCRYWRSVVTSCPWIWTDIMVGPMTPVSRVAAALMNSGALGLHLDLQILWDDDKGPPGPLAILSLLESHSGRIYSLQIRFSYHGGNSTSHPGVAQLIQHPFFGRSFDVLDSLFLSFADTRKVGRHPFASPTGSEKIRGNFPQLRDLTLSGTRYILHPELRCPNLESLSMGFAIARGYWNSEDKEMDFLNQHGSELTRLVILGQAVAQPVEFHQLKSVTLVGGGFERSVGNGVRPTFLTAMTSLEIRVAGLTTITASDADSNSITCSSPHTDPLGIVEAWRAYLGFAEDSVEVVYLDLGSGADAPYDILRGLSNVKTVYVAWAGYKTEGIIIKVTGAFTHPSRGSQDQLSHQKRRMGRWVMCQEDPWTGPPRDEAFKFYVMKWGWGAWDDLLGG